MGRELESRKPQRIPFRANRTAVAQRRSRNGTTNPTSDGPIPTHMNYWLLGDAQRTKGIPDSLPPLAGTEGIDTLEPEK